MFHNNSSDHKDVPQKTPEDGLPFVFQAPSDESSGGAARADFATPPDHHDLSIHGTTPSTLEQMTAHHQPAIIMGAGISEESQMQPPYHSYGLENETNASQHPNTIVQSLQTTTTNPSPADGIRQGKSDTFPSLSEGNYTPKAPRSLTAEFLLDYGRYVGEVDPSTQIPHGKGSLYFNEGDIYNGEWQNGMANGYGERRYANGDIYRGDWVDGKRSGTGVYVSVEGHHFKGSYQNDERNGYGVFVAINNDQYTGEWRNGQKEGKGQEILHDGQRFVGRWRKGKKQGRGRLYLPGIASPIYGVWNNDEFFRELTTTEVGDEFEADLLDSFSGPQTGTRDPFNLHETPNLDSRQGGTHRQNAKSGEASESETFGSRMVAGIMGGISFIEDRLEALGRAFESTAMFSPPKKEVTEMHSLADGRFETATREGFESGVSTVRPTGNASTLGVQQGGLAPSHKGYEAIEAVNIEQHTHEDDAKEESESTHDALHSISLEENVPLHLELS